MKLKLLTNIKEILSHLSRNARLVKRDSGKAYIDGKDKVIFVHGHTANKIIRYGYVIEERREEDYPLLGKRYGLSERGREILKLLGIDNQTSTETEAERRVEEERT